VAGGAFDLPLPDAMPLWHPPNAEMFASLLGSGADAAIACPCQVANSIRFGQGITSFVRETNGHCHQRVAPRSNRIGIEPSGGPAPRKSATTATTLFLREGFRKLSAGRGLA
jgi:hypothetical protein